MAAHTEVTVPPTPNWDVIVIVSAVVSIGIGTRTKTKLPPPSSTSAPLPTPFPYISPQNRIIQVVYQFTNSKYWGQWIVLPWSFKQSILFYRTFLVFLILRDFSLGIKLS